jgi:hypothetical protein
MQGNRRTQRLIQVLHSSDGLLLFWGSGATSYLSDVLAAAAMERSIAVAIHYPEGDSIMPHIIIIIIIIIIHDRGIKSAQMS